MKLIIVTLSNATIVASSILDYIAQGNIVYITTKSGNHKLVFGSKEGVIDTDTESGKKEAAKAKTDIDMFLCGVQIDTLVGGSQMMLTLDNCEIWN